MSASEPVRVFEPKDPREAVQGWALHATRRRRLHEHEARRLDRLRGWLGTTTTCLGAITGTSAFAAWQSSRDDLLLGAATAALGIAAAVLGSVLTFLDPGGRAEAHRHAAVAYKGILREFEAASAARPEGRGPIDLDVIQAMKALLAQTDAAAPVVPMGRAERLERSPFLFVETAEELATSRPASGR